MKKTINNLHSLLQQGICMSFKKWQVSPEDF